MSTLHTDPIDDPHYWEFIPKSPPKNSSLDHFAECWDPNLFNANMVNLYPMENAHIEPEASRVYDTSFNNDATNDDTNYELAREPEIPHPSGVTNKKNHTYVQDHS